VDTDYNRNGEEPKRLGAAIAYPDIIVHERRNNQRNLLIIEIKKTKNANSSILPSSWEDDMARIRKFIASEVYKYSFGYFVAFRVGGEFPEVAFEKWFE
jgi:hypothetical protein